MLTEQTINRLKELIDEKRLLIDEPMDKHTTFRVGGRADAYISVKSRSELKELLGILKEEEVPYYVIGNGSNLLVSDKGYRGVIIEIGSLMAGIEATEDGLRAEAGVLLSTLGMTACRMGLKGLEFATGIPGSVGGAMVMNAGAYGGEMSQVVKEVVLFDPEKMEELTLSNSEMDFGYRRSIVKDKKLIVTAVEFSLEKGDEKDIKAVIDELAKKRRDKQPLEYPSAGSTFKRPEGFYAGALIEESGLKGYSVGGAQVSEKHAGFVINKGKATALDVYCLIREVKEQVYADSGIILEPEVIVLGDFS